MFSGVACLFLICSWCVGEIVGVPNSVTTLGGVAVFMVRHAISLDFRSPRQRGGPWRRKLDQRLVTRLRFPRPKRAAGKFMAPPPVAVSLDPMSGGLPSNGVLHHVVRENRQTFLWELNRRHDEQYAARVHEAWV